MVMAVAAFIYWEFLTHQALCLVFRVYHCSHFYKAYCVYGHCTGEGTKAQRGLVTSSKSHHLQETEPGVESTVATIKKVRGDNTQRSVLVSWLLAAIPAPGEVKVLGDPGVLPQGGPWAGGGWGYNSSSRRSPSLSGGSREEPVL